MKSIDDLIKIHGTNTVMDWEYIETAFPKAFNALLKDYGLVYKSPFLSKPHLEYHYNFRTLYDFFEKNGLFVFVTRYYQDYYYYRYYIQSYFIPDYTFESPRNSYSDRIECERQAFVMAFKFMEEKFA
jgi:hypothetical protein